MEAENSTIEYIFPEPLQGNDIIQRLYEDYQKTLTDELYQLGLLTQEQEFVVLGKYIELRDLEETEEIRKSKQILIDIMTGYNIGLMYDIIVKQLVRFDLPYDDKDLYMTDAYFGILQTMNLFKYEEVGQKFSTYATYWIKKYVLESIEEQSELIHLPKRQKLHIRGLRRIQEKISQQTDEEIKTEELFDQYALQRQQEKKEGIKRENIKAALQATNVVSIDAPSKEDNPEGQNMHRSLTKQERTEDDNLEFANSKRDKFAIPTSVLADFVQKLIDQEDFLNELEKRRLLYQKSYLTPKEILAKEREIREAEITRKAISWSKCSAIKKIQRKFNNELEKENGHFRNFKL